jgi:hypothetical protein
MPTSDCQMAHVSSHGMHANGSTHMGTPQQPGSAALAVEACAMACSACHDIYAVHLLLPLQEDPVKYRCIPGDSSARSC